MKDKLDMEIEEAIKPLVRFLRVVCLFMFIFGIIIAKINITHSVRTRFLNEDIFKYVELPSYNRMVFSFDLITYNQCLDYINNNNSKYDEFQK